MGIVLETKQVSKHYGAGENLVKAVDCVDIQIEQGEFITIIGKSGSGKSTFLHMLGGLDSPTAGDVYIDGENIASLPEEKLAAFRRHKIGFIFQAFNLVPSLNVWENIVLPIGLDNREVDVEFVKELIDTLGLSSKTKNLPGTLSGGQQQRVAIARAIASRPAIILADEPTGNLDSKTSDEVMELLKMSVKKYNQTLIVITHDDEISVMGDRAIVLEDGKVVNK